MPPSPPARSWCSVEALVGQPVVKLMLRHEQVTADDLLTRGRDACGHLAEFSHSNVNGGLLEISAAGVSKASALARRCDKRGIDRRDVVAFGDMPNDLPMLAWAGHGVAVANAHPEETRRVRGAIAAADEVTASNDDADGARVLERLFGLS